MPRSDMLDDGHLFRALLEATGDSVYVKDRQCRLRRASRSMARNLGFADPADLLGKSDADLFGREFAERTLLEDTRVMESDQPITGLVESRQLPDGSLNWTHTSKLPLHDQDGNVIGLIGITREINELKQAETNLQYLATHDTLTALPNRYLMMDRLNQVLARSRRHGTSFALLFADIDDFKLINDSCGHAAGDELLRTLARRLRACVRASDTVARIGGDEFVVIVEGADRPGATVVADKVRKTLTAPLTLAGRRVRVTASVGISLCPEQAVEAESLLTAADHAMYLAKRNGKNGQLVYPGGVPGAAALRARPRSSSAGRRRSSRVVSAKRPRLSSRLAART